MKPKRATAKEAIAALVACGAYDEFWQELRMLEKVTVTNGRNLLARFPFGNYSNAGLSTINKFIEELTIESQAFEWKRDLKDTILKTLVRVGSYGEQLRSRVVFDDATQNYALEVWKNDWDRDDDVYTIYEDSYYNEIEEFLNSLDEKARMAEEKERFRQTALNKLTTEERKALKL